MTFINDVIPMQNQLNDVIGAQLLMGAFIVKIKGAPLMHCDISFQTLNR